jgi:hypothetical protein
MWGIHDLSVAWFRSGSDEGRVARARRPRPVDGDLPSGASGLLALGGDPDDVPGQVTALHRGDDPRSGIELPAAQTVTGGSGEGMVVVVPGLPEGDRRQPGEVAGLIAGDERSPAEEVAERVDAEGGVMQKEHAHGDAEPAAPTV